jgi:hypothetical protein
LSSQSPPDFQIVPIFVPTLTFATAMMSENRTEAELNGTGLLFKI